MHVCDLLNKDSIIINSKSSTKDEVINEIVKLAKSSYTLDDYSVSELIDKFKAREDVSSTAITNKIAIPHCSLPNLDTPLIGVIKTENSIDYNQSNNLVDLFIFIIAPDNKTTKYIKILSSIVKVLKNENLANSLLSCNDEKSVIDFFNLNIKVELDDLNKHNNKSMITVIIQKEEYFSDILETVAEEVGGSVVIYEGDNASKYLHHHPLFSAFWNSPQNNYCTIITSIIDRVAVNTVVRKVKSIVSDIEETQGVLFTVSNIDYSIGSLNL